MPKSSKPAEHREAGQPPLWCQQQREDLQLWPQQPVELMKQARHFAFFLSLSTEKQYEEKSNEVYGEVKV